MSESDSHLRSRAHEALAEDNWRVAAELFSKAIASSRQRLKSGDVAGGAALADLAMDMGGRSRALVEMGKARGQLAAQPEVLKAALADARASVALGHRTSKSSRGAECLLQAVRALQGALAAAGEPLQEAQDAASQAIAAAGSLALSAQELRDFERLAAGGDKASLSAEMDAAADDGRSPGTFRWPLRMSLPALPSTVASLDSVSDKGWEPFLRDRGGTAMIATARSNAILLDALSFPLSLAWVLGKSGAVRWAESSGGDLHVLVLGATSKAEVRIWKESEYWKELEVLLANKCSIQLHFVGPEIDADPDKPSNVHFVAPPCAKSFLRDRQELTPQNTVCAVFNGGFGNFVASGQDGLLWSWLPDLLFLAEEQFFCTFFCANDYADLRGEVAVHASLLGSRFVLAPRRNPFSMATVYTGEAGSEGSDEWFSGNSFVYATCGCELSSRHPAAAASLYGEIDAAARQTLAGVVQSKAKVAANKEGPALEVCSGSTPLLRPGPAASIRGSTAAMAADRKPGYFCIEAGEVRFEATLPGISSIDAVDLQISETHIALSTPEGFEIREPWPERVDADRARASFSSRKEKLVVKAPKL